MQNIANAKQRTSVAMKIFMFILSGLLTLSIGSLMGLVGGAKEGYSGLNRPIFTPPDIVFPIAWSILYFIMGGAFYLVIDSATVSREQKTLRTVSIALFIIQFVVNIVWPIIFFRADMYLFAFVWLCILVALVVALTIITFKVNKASAIMLIPYVAWLIFASYLNLMVLVFN